MFSKLHSLNIFWNFVNFIKNFSIQFLFSLSSYNVFRAPLYFFFLIIFTLFNEGVHARPIDLKNRPPIQEVIHGGLKHWKVEVDGKPLFIRCDAHEGDWVEALYLWSKELGCRFVDTHPIWKYIQGIKGDFPRRRTADQTHWLDQVYTYIFKNAVVYKPRPSSSIVGEVAKVNNRGRVEHITSRRHSVVSQPIPPMNEIPSVNVPVVTSETYPRASIIPHQESVNEIHPIISEGSNKPIRDNVASEVKNNINTNTPPRSPHIIDNIERLYRETVELIKQYPLERIIICGAVVVVRYFVVKWVYNRQRPSVSEPSQKRISISEKKDLVERKETISSRKVRAENLTESSGSSTLKVNSPFLDNIFFESIRHFSILFFVIFGVISIVFIFWTKDKKWNLLDSYTYT